MRLDLQQKDNQRPQSPKIISSERTLLATCRKNPWRSPLRVNRADLGLRLLLPLSPNKPTFSEAVSTSQKDQDRPLSRCGARLALRPAHSRCHQFVTR